MLFQFAHYDEILKIGSQALLPDCGAVHGSGVSILAPLLMSSFSDDHVAKWAKELIPSLSLHFDSVLCFPANFRKF